VSQRYDITTAYLEKNDFRPLHAGDDWSHPFTAQRPAGLALDLTNAKLWLTIKENSIQTDAEALLQITSNDATEIEIDTPAAGQFTVYFKSAQTLDLEGTHSYDIQAVLDSGEVVTLARGIIEFLPNITISTAFPP
jgi:hypothetical protein